MIVLISCVAIGIIVFVILYFVMECNKDKPSDEDIEALESDQVLFNWDENPDYFLAK